MYRAIIKLQLVTVLAIGATTITSDVQAQRRITGLRITGITALDEGEAGDETLVIDVVQDICDAETDEVEPFFETILKVQVLNNRNQIVRFQRARAIIRRGQTGGRLRTRRTSVLGIAEIGPVSTGDVRVPFLDIVGTEKRLVGTTDTVSENVATRNVRVILRGINDRGQRVRVRGKTALAFRNVDRCG